MKLNLRQPDSIFENRLFFYCYYFVDKETKKLYDINVSKEIKSRLLRGELNV